jgi:glycosyltransferase involved in cell wall biosynthesis
MVKEKIPILVIGDAVATTGFARVMHGVFENLPKAKYDVHHLGVNYRGDPHGFKSKIYPAIPGGSYNIGDIYGISRIGQLLNAIKPKLVFILNDVWVLPTYMKELRNFMDRGFKVVTYSPIDAQPIEWRWLTDIRDAHRVVVYTEFAKQTLENSFHSWKDFLKDNDVQDQEATFPPISVVPHGVDKEAFHPLKGVKDRSGDVIMSGRINAKRKVYPNQEDFINSFIVLNANRNQPRKRIDLTMKGFALFAKDKPKNVKLYLHMGTDDMGWNIIHLAERYQIDSKLIISSDQPQMPQVSDQRLNEIYNACDVGINTSLGEGWGLVSFEHAATKAAQIVPRHSSQPEIWGDSAEYLEIDRWMTTEKILTEGGFVSPEGVADALQKFYDDPKHLEDMSQKAYKVTQRPEYSWKSVAKKFDKLFTEVLNE